MKIFIILSLLSSSTYCFNKLSLVSSRSEGRHELKLEEKEDKLVVSTNSNLFFNDKNYFGDFTIKNNNSDFSKSIDYYLVKLVELDNNLKLKGSSLSKLYPQKRHEFFFLIDDVLISKDNPFYDKFSKLIFDKIQQSKLNFSKKVTYQSGSLTIDEDSKVTKERLDRQKACSGTANSGVCKIKDLGFIIL